MNTLGLIDHADAHHVVRPARADSRGDRLHVTVLAAAGRRRRRGAPGTGRRATRLLAGADRTRYRTHRLAHHPNPRKEDQ
jgi:hypothetical protein